MEKAGQYSVLTQGAALRSDSKKLLVICWLIQTSLLQGIVVIFTFIRFMSKGDKVYEHVDTTIPGTCQRPGLWSQGTVSHWHQRTEWRSGQDTHDQSITFSITSIHHHGVSCEGLSVDCYLCSVGAGQAQFNDEDRLGGDNGVGRGVGRRSDHWVCAALSCHHREQSRG